MKPAFALNLSPDGISLLHRTSRGWLVVGAVALDDPDMPAALGYLRKTALGLAPRGFATKLILPASQILYTAVEAPGPDAANRRRQIARALEGRTPYAAEDLVFDWSGTGGRVNVAVVARETLEEAEAFALEHRFNPVSFVAIPEDGAFAGEPFFGQTAKARDYIPEGERLVRDQDPVRISGEAELTRLATGSVAEVALSEVTAPAAADDPQEAAGRPSDMEAGPAGAGIAPGSGAAEGAAAALPAAAAPEEPVDASGNDSPAPDAAPVDGRAERRRARAERREREAAAAAVARQASFELAAAAPDAAEPAEAPLQEDAPALVAPDAPLAAIGGDIASADGAAPDAAPGVEADAEAEDPEEAPFLAVEDEPEDMAEDARPLARTDADGVPTPFAAAATLSPVMPGQRPGAATPALGRAGPARPLADAGTGSVISPRLGIAAEPRAEHRATPGGTGARASGLGKAVIAAGKMAKAAKKARGSNRVEAGPGPAAPRARESEAEALTVFGARRAAPVRGKPRYLGLMLTAGLVVLMLAIALWASLPDGTTDAAAPSAGTGPARSAAVEALADPQAFEDVPSVDALEADAMTEAEIAADGGFEAMGLAEDGDESLTAEPADLPVDQPEDVPEGPAGTADALPGDAPVMGSSAAPDAAAAAAIAAAGALVAADIATAAPGVPAAAAGGPLPDAAEGLPPRQADPALTERSAEGLPETATLAADALPAPPQPPLPYGTGFQFGADGTIVATPDGSMTPDGVTVVDGAPARVPPSRPVVEAAAELVAEPEADPALIGRKPLSRPAALELPAADTPAAGAPVDAGAGAPPALAVDPALAGFKPRSASTVAVAAAAAARNAEAARAAELAALQAELASATASAVTSSRKPVSRPQDFSQGIAAALAMAATTAPAVAAAAPPPQAAPAPPAPAPAATPTRQAAVAPAPEPEELDEPEPVAAAPSIPTTASVAKQATISGAISLREINLIGVYGASSNRRALVRLANGRMLRVKIGDRIDGGQVTAIGEGQLTYQKGGRTHVLRMIQQS